VKSLNGSPADGGTNVFYSNSVIPTYKLSGISLGYIEMHMLFNILTK